MADNWPTSALQGLALFDTERDKRVMALGPYSDFADALLHIPLVVARFGPGEVTRISLQLIYEYSGFTTTYKAAGDCQSTPKCHKGVGQLSSGGRDKALARSVVYDYRHASQAGCLEC